MAARLRMKITWLSGVPADACTQRLAGASDLYPRETR